MELQKEVCDATRKSYLDFFHFFQVYEPMKKSFQLCKGRLPHAKYYNELNFVFMELDYWMPNDMENANDNEKLKKHITKDRVYIFLVRLERHFDQVSSHFFLVFFC